ncbi:hypothetical protein PN836_010125 [Ningiella sp. W23]|uniref:hypothetical protein n=1 Tax=Ningiella sp. W23 TaxID=3023715 RepID=UPI0037571AB0
MIKPLPHWTHWDAQAQSIHGISPEILATHGDDPVEVCVALNEFANGQTLYSDAWVVDYTWVIKLFSECKVHMAFKLSSIEMVMTESQFAIWDDAKTKVISECGLVRHRASSDAFVIQKTYQQTCSLMQHSQ